MRAWVGWTHRVLGTKVLPVFLETTDGREVQARQHSQQHLEVVQQPEVLGERDELLDGGTDGGRRSRENRSGDEIADLRGARE